MFFFFSCADASGAKVYGYQTDGEGYWEGEGGEGGGLMRILFESLNVGFHARHITRKLWPGVGCSRWPNSPNTKEIRL